MARSEQPTVAVVGAGVAGLTAAHVLRRRYAVTVLEADDRLGGHAHTHDLGDVSVDSGFIVHNTRTYPTLLRLFGELGVPTQDAEMSMSVRCDGCGLEYAGARRLAGLFPRWSTLRRPAYLRMLGEVLRFHRHARATLARDDGTDPTLGEFLAAGRYSRYTTEHFVLPLVACVWSAGEAVSTAYPARYLFRFLHHHGLLAVGGSPRWRTVVGGSARYVEKAAAGLPVRAGTPVRAVVRTADGVEVRDAADAVHRVDRVVLATHADTALALLAAPTPAEKEVLGAFGYSHNLTQLHRDTSLLPRAPRARASWNYLKPACTQAPDAPVLVSYDMDRLQRLAGPDRHVVTLNGADRVDPERVLATMRYAHPVYTRESVAAQARLPELNDGVVAFAGSYHGWGFHEDGCVAGVAAAASLGVEW